MGTLATTLSVILSISALPAAEVAGTWTHRGDDGLEGTLELRQSGQSVSGTYTEGGISSVVTGSLDTAGFVGRVVMVGEAMAVRAERQGQTLVVLVQEPGQFQPTRLVFRAAAGQEAAAPAPADQPAARPAIAAAAPPGLEKLDAVGAAFAPPAGFAVQRTAQGLVATDAARALALVVFTHHHRNAAELARQARNAVEDGGVALRPVSVDTCKRAGADGVQVSYTGSANGAPAEGRGIALVGADGGGPCFLLVGRAGSLDAAALKVLDDAVASVRFYAPVAQPLVAQAKARLAGRTLSWYSSGGTYTGGSWSSERSLALGGDGRYRRSGETSNTGANGQVAGASANRGTWDCVAHGAGVAVLLRGDDGSTQTLPIELTDKQDVVLLGGQKWALPP
jgi:hypothetical protein